MGVVLALAITAALASSAKADNPGGLTCGQTNGADKGIRFTNGGETFYFYHISPENIWYTDFGQKCGTGGTVGVEIQKSSNGTSGWADIGEGVFGAVDGDYHHRTHAWDTLPSCSNSAYYRVKGWANANAGAYDVDYNWQSGKTNMC